MRYFITTPIDNQWKVSYILKLKSSRSCLISSFTRIAGIGHTHMHTNVCTKMISGAMFNRQAVEKPHLLKNKLPLKNMVDSTKRWLSVCKITTWYRTFSGEKHYVSVHFYMCMEVMSGWNKLKAKATGKPLIYVNSINFNTMSRQLYLCPCKFYDSVSAHASKVIWHTGYGSGDCHKLDIALPYLTRPPILMLSIFKSVFENPNTLVYLSCV